MNYGTSDIDRISRCCYYIGLGIGLLGLACRVLVFAFHIPILQIAPVCFFYTATGYYCPGCGGTRAVMAMMHGKVAVSLYYHPFVLYMAVYYAIFEISHTLDIITKGKIKGIKFCPLYFYIGIVLVLTQWVAKNYLKYRFGFAL